MKNRITTLVKLAVPVAIITWLMLDLQRNHPTTLRQLRYQAKDWQQLILALSLCLGAVSLGIFRWYSLVRALKIPFHLRDAIRLGFLGYLLNFVALGSVGGDLFKGLFLAREQRHHRVEAIATIVVDRVIGLCGLLVVASVAVVAADLRQSDYEIRFVSTCILVLAGVGGFAIVFALVGGKAEARMVAHLARLPKVGPWIQRLASAVQMYRRQKALLAGALVMSIVVHIMLALAIYHGARAVYAVLPTIGEHFVMCPLASVVGALPISPSGLGTFELAMQYLYDRFPAHETGVGKGVVVALCYRVLQIGVVCIGVAFYWFNRRQVAEVFRESNTLNPQESSSDHETHDEKL